MPPALANLVELTQSNAEQLGEAVAYTLLADGTEQEAHLTFREVDRRARAIAGRLQDELRPGDRAVLIFPTSLAFVTTFLGCLYAGVIAVPIPEPLQKRHLLRIRRVMQDAATQTILTTAEFLPLVDQWTAHNPEFTGLRWLATDTIEPEWADRWRQPVLERDTLAFLQYTSGSTGSPRGVMVTHGNLSTNCAMLVEAIELERGAVGVGWLPFFHDMGLLTQVLLPIRLGGRSVLIPPVAFLQRPLRWLRAVSRYGGHYGAAPDFAYALAARKASPEACQGLNLSNWHVAANAAEPVRPDTVRAFTEAFAPYGFRGEAMRPGYGLAEATLLVSLNRRQPPQTLTVDAAAFEQQRVAPAVPGQAARTLVACGSTNLGRQVVRIVQPETRRPAAADEVGEIWIAGEHVAAGYWRNPEETAATFEVRLTDTDDGPFLRTGDLGFVHAGQLYIAGRIKDLIIVDGSNHYPQDLERTVEDAHPAMRPGCTAAFSVDRDGREQVVVVAEVHAAGLADGRANPDEMAQAIRSSVAAQHGLRVDEVAFIRARTILKTSSGKIQRRACRAAYLSNTLERWQAAAP